MGNAIRPHMQPLAAADDLLGAGLGGLTKQQTMEEINRRRKKLGDQAQSDPSQYGDMTLGPGAAAKSLLRMGLA